MHKSKIIMMLFLAITSFASFIQAATLKLAPFYTDNMVFQREKPIVILGLADANATIEGSFMGGTAKTTADANGLFKLVLPAKEASSQGSSATITSGDGKIVLNDVLVGDVWLCSGQSNMELTLNGCGTLGQDDTKSANYPLIRRIKFPHETAVDPVPFMNMKVSGPWAAATPGTVGNWTAVGFYFSRNVHANSKIPIGILDCNWGQDRTVDTWRCVQQLPCSRQ
jgi:sialate O-acetylesterase